MSLITYSSKSKPCRRASKKSVSRAAPTVARHLRNALAATGRLIVTIYEAIGEARLQKAIIEAELYRNRYLHTSKNDDDLPIVR